MKKQYCISLLFAALLVFGIWYNSAFDKINSSEIAAEGQSEYIEETQKSDAAEQTSEPKSENISQNENNSEKDIDKTLISEQNSKYKININTADSQQLQSLPGIGEAKAAAIMEYRSQNGDFKAAEDIKNVSGIGDATFNKISALITVE